MELRHLRHFVAVAEELHFARAAERLGIEQSPLSQSIRKLEDELKVRLLQRTTRRTWLTRAGTRFYQDAKRILDDVNAAAAALMKESGDAPPVIRLALGEDLASGPFNRLLFELEHHTPPVAVDVHEVADGEAVRLVRKGGADVALTLDNRPVGAMRSSRAWDEALMLAVPIGHILAEKDSVELEEISAERIALPTREACPGYLDQIEDLFARHHLAIKNRVPIRHWNTAVSFAATGRAVALCPTSLITGLTTVAVVPLAMADARLTTWLIYPAANESSAVSLVLETAALVHRDPEAFPESVSAD